MGYDLQCFDASDLAFGYERLLEDVVTASGESLASNLRDAEGVPLFYRSTSWSRNRITNGMNAVLKAAGKRIGSSRWPAWVLRPRACICPPPTWSRPHRSRWQPCGPRTWTPSSVSSVPTPTAPTFWTIWQAWASTRSLPAALTEAPAGAPLTVVPAGGGLEAVGRLQLTFTAQGTVEAAADTVSPDTAAAQQPGEYQTARDALDALAAGDEEVRAQTLFTHEEGSRTISFANYVAETYQNLAVDDQANWPAEYQGMTPVALAGGVGELPAGEVTRGALLDALPAPERVQLVLTTGRHVRRAAGFRRRRRDLHRKPAVQGH